MSRGDLFEVGGLTCLKRGSFGYTPPSEEEQGGGLGCKGGVVLL